VEIKQSLVKTIAQKTGISIKDINEIIFSLYELIESNLIKNKKFKFFKFGTFSISEKKQHNKILPNKKKVLVPKKRYVKFTLSGKYKKYSKII